VARFLVPALGIGCTSLLHLGCGGGVPLLHGAHALGPGVTTSTVGFSGVFTTGELRDTIERARQSEPASTTSNRSSAVIGGVGPGVAPMVAMRIGLTGDNEVGLSYTGRSLRFDARHAFETGPWALSLGAGVGGTVGAVELSEPSPGQSTGKTGAYGFDVPALFGWRSDAGIVSLWTGARGGFDQVGALGSAGNKFAHWYVGGLAGLAMGFRHVHVALALETAYHSVKSKGDDTQPDFEVHGLTLTPAGGLLFTF
jgi:hypothetical protein